MTRLPYLLATDSCCDLPRDLADTLGVTVLEFPFTIDGEHHFDDLGASMPAAEFYARMRAGATPTTAQVPMAEYLAAFTAAAENGTPLLFLSFSSELSGTHDAALVARQAVLAEHPDADIRVVDTVSAAVAQGMLVLESAREWQRGATIDELEAFVERAKRRINGYFTIDTLEALRRGGRLSDVAAVAGTMLDVKPVLRMSSDGRLVIDRPVRGRKKSLRSLAEIFDARADDTTKRTVLVAHAGAPDDADALAVMLREKREIYQLLTFDVGPVIGSHTGPGMVACVFWGPERDS
jgi:DegV family protein with EDD domain